MSEEWRGSFQIFKYFIQTSDAITGIYYEEDGVLKGWVISAKPNIQEGQHIIFEKDDVVRELYQDRINIIERVPEWFYSDEAFSSD